MKNETISPFAFVNTINYTKEDIMVDDIAEKQYIPFIVNKGLSFTPDTVVYANEMNSRPHLGKLLQYQFLINIVRKKKRFSKWIKKEKIEAIDIVKEYYGYNTEKARQVVSILSTDQIQTLKRRLYKGGTDGA
tara:strand:+ start:1412 stop:1810 length:399 start_codon:yes stop_codon:yes gene_type:complete